MYPPLDRIRFSGALKILIGSVSVEDNDFKLSVEIEGAAAKTWLGSNNFGSVFDGFKYP